MADDVGQLEELRDRLNVRADTLDDLASGADTTPSGMAEFHRLRGKAEGVRLAVSFVEELIPRRPVRG